VFTLGPMAQSTLVFIIIISLKRTKILVLVHIMHSNNFDSYAVFSQRVKSMYFHINTLQTTPVHKMCYVDIFFDNFVMQEPFSDKCVVGIWNSSMKNPPR
jgi:hypothetical protein